VLNLGGATSLQMTSYLNLNSYIIVNEGEILFHILH